MQLPLPYTETPIVELHDPLFGKAGVRFRVKREDLNHPRIPGNKWWKLKCNLEEFANGDYDALLTFGGAYSNHIYATSAACADANIPAIAIIRGEKTLPLNPTLLFAQANRMKLHYIDRARYRQKENPAFIDELKKRFGKIYIVPEGGSNLAGVRGAAEFATGKLRSESFDVLFLPVGTGGTMAGIICGLDSEKSIKGVSVLKNGEFLKADVGNMVRNFSGRSYGNWDVLASYDHGGYAKAPRDLIRFIVTMNAAHNLPLDRIYTAKMIWAVYREIESGNLARGTDILAIHTGGLQNATTSSA